MSPQLRCLNLLAATPAPPRFSWIVFLALLLIFGSSLLTFLLLVRRWTTQRQWVSLAEWARHREFRFGSTDVPDLPELFKPLEASAGLKVRLSLQTQNAMALQLRTLPPAGSDLPNDWNVFVQSRPKRQPTPAALRPANAPASLFDLMGMSQFPALAVGQRFTVFSTTSLAARTLSNSASRTLLPADVGLLLADQWIVLDFSTRPFDPIELDRIRALAQQLSQML